MHDIGKKLKLALAEKTGRAVVFVAGFKVLDQPSTLSTTDRTLYVMPIRLIKEPLGEDGQILYTVEYRVWETYTDIIQGESILNSSLLDLNIGNTEDNVQFTTITSDTGTVLKGAAYLDCRATFIYAPSNYSDKKIKEMEVNINGFGFVIKGDQLCL